MSFLRKASFAIAAAVLSVGLSSSAFAEDFEDRTGMYLSGTAGYTMPDDPDIELFDGAAAVELEMDEGFSGTLAAGWNLSAFRLEAEAGYRMNDATINFDGPELFDPDGDIETLSAMANLYYDFALNDQWSLYVGGGIGGAYVTIDLAGETENDTVLAYQGMAGIGYAATEDVTITLGYRLFTTEDGEFDNVDVDGPLYHTVEVGLRWDLQ